MRCAPTSTKVSSDATPSEVRAALWELSRRGLASNDHFDLVRRGESIDRTRFLRGLCLIR